MADFHFIDVKGIHIRMILGEHDYINIDKFKKFLPSMNCHFFSTIFYSASRKYFVVLYSSF